MLPRFAGQQFERFPPVLQGKLHVSAIGSFACRMSKLGETVGVSQPAATGADQHRRRQLRAALRAGLNGRFLNGQTITPSVPGEIGKAAFAPT